MVYGIKIQRLDQVLIEINDLAKEEEFLWQQAFSVAINQRQRKGIRIMRTSCGKPWLGTERLD